MRKFPAGKEGSRPALALSMVFMGTPEFAVPSLRAAVAAGHRVIAAYTQPPRPAGRGKRLQPSPVQIAAQALGIAVFSPQTLRDAAAQAEFAAHDADVAVVAAYGLILPAAVLAAPRLGCLNVHASILPRWRGAAPIQRAILAGDVETGVTIMQMERGLDTGPMRLVRTIPVEGKSAGELTAELAELGARSICDVLADPARYPPVPQDDALATHAPKIDKAESRLNFAQAAPDVWRQVRAFAPAPGAWFEWAGERCRVLAAEPVGGAGAPGSVLDDRLTIACGEGAIAPLLVQRAGRPAMGVAEMLRGWAIPAGSRIG